MWALATPARADVVGAHYATHHADIEVDGASGRIAHWSEGDAGAPVVMLVRGLPTSKQLWVHVVPALSDRFGVVVPEPPDLGETVLSADNGVDGVVSTPPMR